MSIRSKSKGNLITNIDVRHFILFTAELFDFNQCCEKLLVTKIRCNIMTFHK